MLLNEHLLIVDWIDVDYLNTCYCYVPSTIVVIRVFSFCHLHYNLGEDLITKSLILLQTCRDCLFSPFKLICFRLHQTIFRI